MCVLVTNRWTGSSAQNPFVKGKSPDFMGKRNIPMGNLEECGFRFVPKTYNTPLEVDVEELEGSSWLESHTLPAFQEQRRRRLRDLH